MPKLNNIFGKCFRETAKSFLGISYAPTEFKIKPEIPEGDNGDRDEISQIFINIEQII